MKHLVLIILLIFTSSCGDAAKKGSGKTQGRCGNGVLDEGEMCDPAINSGSGLCERGCAAPACSTAILIGSANTCDATCVIEAIACLNADGCCPIGCDSSTDDDCTNTCGNGVLEIPELCDGADCPTTCGGADACSRSTLKGSSDNCTATCLETSVEACVDADGCCPTGCDANSDSDCASADLCGNDSIDDGETCDGECPESCDDNDSCTVDQKIGSADTCSVRCVFETIDMCVSNDGCCPAGCTEANDSDCDPKCGNGTIDDGEICDGNCPSSCDDNQVCTADKLIGSSTTCNGECSFTTINQCKNGDGCCPNNCTFDNDNDCACVPDTCNGLNLECGNHDDGCQGTINCGTCNTGTCNVAGQCVDAGNGQVGDACAADNDCAMSVLGSLCLNEPGGYCSENCISLIAPCANSTDFCVDDPNMGVGNCRKGCSSNNDCRQGYSCQTVVTNLLTTDVCLPR